MSASFDNPRTWRVVTAMLAACAACAPAWPDAPQVRTQAPAFYRIMLGDLEITALSDGVFDLDTPALLVDAHPPRARELMANAYEPARLPTSVNAYLVNTGERLILVDAGAAHLFGPTLGHLLENLAASGYRPDRVDAVLLTHLHPDHVGGLLADGKRAFPNATVYADRRDAEFWLNPQARETAPPERRAFFAGAAAAIKPYADAGRFETFSAPAAILPGVRAVPAPGHTPGHTMYAIESRGQTLVAWGDLMELASVQFVAPEVTIAYDSDSQQTVRERTRAFADAATHGWLVAGAHLPFPGIGHVRSTREGYAWLPVEYQTLPPRTP